MGQIWDPFIYIYNAFTRCTQIMIHKDKLAPLFKLKPTT